MPKDSLDKFITDLEAVFKKHDVHVKYLSHSFDHTVLENRDIGFSLDLEYFMMREKHKGINCHGGSGKIR